MLNLAVMLLSTLASSAPPRDGLEKAQTLVARAFDAHGADRLRETCLEFTFRGTPYRVVRSGGEFRYERVSNDLVEVLSNEGFTVLKDGVPVSLSEKERSGGRQSINSVVYFASLPLSLRDPGVHVRALPNQSVKGTELNVVEVRFEKAGGGDFPDDVFRYWLHPETGLIEYLGYRTTAGGGRVRFRTLVDRQRVDGVVFSNWENYGLSDPAIPLEELPARWLTGRLPKISEVILDEIKIGCEGRSDRP